MVKTGNKEIDYLLILLNCALKGEKAPVDYSVDINALLKLANSQQVYNTILPSLQEIEILSKEDNERWNNFYLSELQRTVYVNSIRESICAQLDEAKIKYMFLKGLVIREYYPKSLMRQMSDNDILFDSTKRDELAKIMKKNGFCLTYACDKSDDYYKEPNCLIEFHRQFFRKEDDDEFYDVSTIWQRAEKVENSYRYIMSKEDNYIFALAHMHKHYRLEGCGIRFLCDMFLLSNEKGLDWEYINSFLDKIGLSQFNQTVLGLIDCVFGNKKINDDEKKLLDFMFEGSVYGTFKSLNETINEHGGKLGYVFYRIFPPKRIMVSTYSALQSKPYLIGYYYIKRLFDRLVHRKSQIKKEVNSLKKMK
jgi:hypothetical protein